MNFSITKVLMLVEQMYPRDVRVRKEALALTAAGYQVVVIGLKGKCEPSYEQLDGVHIYRVPKLILFKKINSSKPSFVQRLVERVKPVLGYCVEHLYFTLACLAVSIYVHFEHGIDVVHTHNPPDTLFIVGGLFKLLGKKYVFDHHDLSPDLYRVRCGGKRDLIYRILLACERISCRLADVIISTNHSYREIEIKRHSVKPSKIFIVRNNPILSECLIPCNANGARPATIKKHQLLCLGSINPQDGVDLLMQSLHYLVKELKFQSFACTVVGHGDALDYVKDYAKDLNLNGYVDFRGYIGNRHTIKKYLHSAEIGLEPAPDNYLNRHSTFIKVMEYMAAGMAVVAFDLKETRYTVDGSAVLTPPGDVERFAFAIKTLLEDPERIERLGKAAQVRVRSQLSWDAAASNLLQAYEHLNGRH